MGQFTNVKIIGAGAGADARSSTGDSTTGGQYNQLNIFNLNNFAIHSLSSMIPASFIKTSASAGVHKADLSGHDNLIGGYGVHSASAQPLSAAAFMSIVDDVGVQWVIPLLKPIIL